MLGQIIVLVRVLGWNPPPPWHGLPCLALPCLGWRSGPVRLCFVCFPFFFFSQEGQEVKN